MLQILWGAFVAGLDAGLYFNTFPLMGGQVVPPGAMTLEPALRNLVENPITVQWVHRVLGTVLALASLTVLVQHWRLPADLASRRLSTAFATLVVVQYGLGILTVIYFVPVSLGVLHQATAVVILGTWLAWLHHVRNLPAMSVSSSLRTFS
jgi:cytochrome c oxidase assembly protein subunit 15